MLKFILVLLLTLTPATVAKTDIQITGGKIYQPKADKKKTYGTVRPLTRTQKIQQGLIKEPRMVTCRLKKRVKTKSGEEVCICLLYTSPSPRDLSTSRMPSSA